MKYEPEYSVKNETDSTMKLSLRKPKNWNWSVDTSSLSSTIVVPSIQLWDEEKGSLLVDTRYPVRYNTSAICNKQDKMQKVNGDERRIRSSKIPSKLSDERLEVNSFQTNSNGLKGKSRPANKSKNNNPRTRRGQDLQHIFHSEALSQTIKTESEKSLTSLPVKVKNYLHVPKSKLQSRSVSDNCIESKPEYNKASTLFRSSKDNYDLKKDYLKPNTASKMSFHEKTKTQNNLAKEKSSRSTFHVFKINGSKISENNFQPRNPVSSANTTKTDQSQRNINKSPDRIPKVCRKQFQQTRLPVSDFQKSCHKKSINEELYKSRSNIYGLYKNKDELTTLNKELLHKKLKNYQQVIKGPKDKTPSITYPESNRSKRIEVENDLKNKETTSTSKLKNLRKKHKELSGKQKLRVVNAFPVSENPKITNNFITVQKIQLPNGKSEVKQERKIRSTSLTKNWIINQTETGVSGKDISTLSVHPVKDKFEEKSENSNTNVKSVKYVILKSNDNSAESLSRIPMKKQFTRNKSTTDKYSDLSVRSTNINIVNEKRPKVKSLKVGVCDKTSENEFNMGNVDNKHLRQINGLCKPQGHKNHKTIKAQKPSITSTPIPSKFNSRDKGKNYLKGTNTICTCLQGTERTFNKGHGSSSKKVYKEHLPRVNYEEESSFSSEPELILLWDQSKKKRKSRNTKGDRLLGINGQCVHHPEEARDLLRQSGDVVSLQLSRNVIGSQSLPRNRADSTHETEDKDMGSNVSRHSGKGLTGRRSQSSGNLCNGKMRPSVGRFFSPCSRSEVDSVGKQDRYKFCGSLPNHLDSKDPVLDEMSETDDDSSYRNNNNVPVLNHQINNKKNVELRLHPLVSKGTQHGHQDSVTNDQGYASERSPEDEVPPSIVGTCPVHHKPLKQQYPIITKNSTFTVTLQKGTRGLGLSVTGGIETDERWPGLIRIKRLFPHQPAWQSGHLVQGDILIAANNTPLTGLTNYEALEVLRTTPTDVILTVCRPPPEIQLLNATSGTDSAPAPPKRDLHSTSGLLLPLKRQESFGEFEITLRKVNGSLGFTLRKEDESVLGHYVRALVKEPAFSDGRIKPGDKIVAVNHVPMSPMSHEEAVMFLRQCDEEVHLKLFRDPVQTPVLALSPTEAHRTFKPILRKEAQDMLSDLAVKKSLSPNDSTGSSTLSRLGRSSSPRKRRLTKTPSSDDQLNGGGSFSWSNEVSDRIIPGNDNDKPSRPDSLNLYAKHKPHFQFASTVTVTEETGLSSDELDSTSQNQIVEEAESPVGVGPLPSEPVSMPPVLSSSSTGGFSYRNPAYRSANPSTTKTKGSMCEELPENRCSDNDLSGSASGGIEGSKSLLKWKGVLFSPEDRNNSVNSPEDSISQITETEESCDNQVLVIELMRGWNSRLGFSLQQSGGSTVISAIHSDSVASRDGRLKPGDQLVMVNDESVERMSTSEVIDLLRRIRGVICITVWRKLKD